MARKRSIFFHPIQSFLKSLIFSKIKYRQKITAIFLAFLTLFTVLIIPVLITPVIATENNALKLEDQGIEYYNRGEFAESAKFWQQAADAFGKNEEGKNRNLTNKAKALQSLGLYPEACNQILQTFGLFDLTCEREKLTKNQEVIFNQIEGNPDSLTLNKIKNLRLFGEILQRLDELDFSEKILEKLNEKLNKKLDRQEKKETQLKFDNSQLSQEYESEKGAVLLSLGNIKRVIGNKKRDELSYHQILKAIYIKSNAALEICDSSSNMQSLNDKKSEIVLVIQTLQLYNQACGYYQQAAINNSKFPKITQVQGKLNQLSLLVEMKQWWGKQIDSRAEATKITKTKQKFNSSILKEKFDENINKLLPQIEYDLKHNLSPSRESVYAKINFTDTVIRYHNNTQDNYKLRDKNTEQENAKILSTAAIKEARILGDKQGEAAALSSLARLYEAQVLSTEKLTEKDQLNLNKAKQLTQQALALYNDINIDNRQILYRQRRQLGRILKAQGNIEGALVSYAEAWNILESLRADLITSADNQFSFRQNVEPVYREFIDLLLQPESSKIDLIKLVLPNKILEEYKIQPGDKLLNNSFIASLVMNSLQLAELDNFFQEPCSLPEDKRLQDKRLRIDDIDENAAIIYPIILKKRLEIIISRKGKEAHHYATYIPELTVSKTIEDLANYIYNPTQIQSNSALGIRRTPIGEEKGNVTTQEDQEQEDKLKKCDPTKIWLEENDDIESALNCNQQKVKELSQSLYDWLIGTLEKNHELNPKINHGSDSKNTKETLVFILDRPFQRIPISALFDGQHYLLEKYNLALNLGQPLIQPKRLERKNIKILAAGVSKAGKARGITFPELNGTNTELEDIENLKNEVSVEKPLYNEHFTKKTLQEKIKSAPNIVHLSTHGIFSSNREQTFILAGDKVNIQKDSDSDNNIISIDDFLDLLNPKDEIRNRTIELLVLSACQTASGDERAALGIAGVAQRSGARSTIAALWTVSEEPTAKLMKEFYHNLTSGELTRVQALRKAQLSLLKDTDGKYQDPFYWAPFILLGNWL
jgi:CHAT domain-containing protein